MPSGNPAFPCKTKAVKHLRSPEFTPPNLLDVLVSVNVMNQNEAIVPGLRLRGTSTRPWRSQPLAPCSFGTQKRNSCFCSPRSRGAFSSQLGPDLLPVDSRSSRTCDMEIKITERGMYDKSRFAGLLRGGGGAKQQTC